jgi:hypothetical protein
LSGTGFAGRVAGDGGDLTIGGNVTTGGGTKAGGDTGLGLTGVTFITGTGIVASRWLSGIG